MSPGLRAAAVAGELSARGVDLADRVDDIVRRVEPIHRVTVIERRIHRLQMKRGRQLERGRTARAAATGAAIRFWLGRLTEWDRRSART